MKNIFKLQIEEIEDHLKTTPDNRLKNDLRKKIRQLRNNKKELTKNAKKLIDLSHKTLIFLDSPQPELFNGLMPLLSHDKYELENEYTDTHNEIKTKTKSPKRLACRDICSGYRLQPFQAIFRNPEEIHNNKSEDDPKKVRGSY